MNNYTRYRCRDWPWGWSHASAAAKEVLEGESRPYKLLDDNCLTRSVNIFEAYGMSLPNAVLTQPNNYFENVLSNLQEGGPPTVWGQYKI
jgi:hypothetical protein